MGQCPHKHLLVVTEASERLRCRRCHLTIKPEEVMDGCCPECYEQTGRRYDDFERINIAEQAATRYRCEQCGAMMNPVTP